MLYVTCMVCVYVYYFLADTIYRNDIWHPHWNVHTKEITKGLTRLVSKLSEENLNLNILLGYSIGRIFENKELSGAMPQNKNASIHTVNK